MKVFRNISCLLFALLVLMSSTSFMVGMHLCSGEIENIALFSKAEGCEMEKQLPPCHQGSTAPCCEDQSFVHDGYAFKAGAFTPQLTGPLSVDFDKPFVLIAEVIPFEESSRVTYRQYDPPLPSSDLNVELRVFRI